MDYYAGEKSSLCFDLLSKQEQQWVQEAASESVPLERKLWQEAEDEAMKVIKEAGVEVIRPDKSKFEGKVESIYESYKDEAEVYQLIKEIKAN